MKTKQQLEAIEPAIFAIMSDPNALEALKFIGEEEIRLAEREAVGHIREGRDRLAQFAVGKVDGINNFLSALSAVALGYQKRKTSASKT